MLRLIDLFGCKTLLPRMYKIAERKRQTLNAQHVVFGITRNKRGQLISFYLPLDDAQLDQFSKLWDGYIHAVHA